MIMQLKIASYLIAHIDYEKDDKVLKELVENYSKLLSTYNGVVLDFNWTTHKFVFLAQHSIVSVLLIH